MELEQAERQQSLVTGSDELSKEAQSLSKKKSLEPSGKEADKDQLSAKNVEPKLPDNPFIPKHQYSEMYRYADGLLRYNLNADGRTIRESVFHTNDAPNGDYDETYYGQRAEDNVTVRRRLEINPQGTEPLIKIKCTGADNRELGQITVRENGSSIVYSKDINGNVNYNIYDKNQNLIDKITVTTDNQGNTIEEFSTGARRMLYTDGSKYERAIKKDGSGIDTYYGRKGEEIYSEDFDKAGKFAEPGPEETRLRALIAKLDQEPQGDCLSYIDRFSKRSLKDYVSRVETQLTFRAAADLLEATGDKPLNGKQRTHLAANILANAANPGTIYQGNHNTCPTASDEAEKYYRHPALAALAVAQIGLTGHYKDDRGRDIEVDATPHGSSKVEHPGDNNRNHASEIYQVLAIKKALLETGEERGIRLDYNQLDVATSADKSDTGERYTEILADGSSVPAKLSDGVLRDCIYILESARMGKEMLKQLPTSIIMGDGTKSGAAAPKTEAILMVHAEFSSDPAFASYWFEDEFANKLLDYKRRGQMPVRMSIEPASEPFRSQIGGWKGPGNYDRHDITATDIKVDSTGKVISVTVENSWRKASDCEMTLHDLYMATRSTPCIIEALEAETSPKANPSLELDLIHLKMNTKELSIEQGVHQANSLLAKWTAEPVKLTAADKTLLLPKLDSIVRNVPPILALSLLQHEQDSGFLTEKAYDDRLKDVASLLVQNHALNKSLSAQKAAQSTEHMTELQNYINRLPAARRTELLNHLKAKQKEYEKP